jgi:hypothetical protein
MIMFRRGTKNYKGEHKSKIFNFISVVEHSQPFFLYITVVPIFDGSLRLICRFVNFVIVAVMVKVSNLFILSIGARRPFCNLLQLSKNFRQLHGKNIYQQNCVF